MPITLSNGYSQGPGGGLLKFFHLEGKKTNDGGQGDSEPKNSRLAANKTGRPFPACPSESFGSYAVYLSFVSS
jgi:hypothetical protein